MTVQKQKASVLVAEQIVQDVMRNGLAAGQSLPPEHVMIEQYQTARSTLREALRLLEFQGVIMMKTGPGGGPIVIKPDGSSLRSAMALFLQFRGAPYRTVVEVRFGMEPMISALAASRMTTGELDELQRNVDDMAANLGDQNLFIENNRIFHDVIARASGNVLFECIVTSLMSLLDNTMLNADYPHSRREKVLDAHVAIFEALKTRDPMLAEMRMREHVEGYRRYAEKRYPELLDQVIGWHKMIN